MSREGLGSADAGPIGGGAYLKSRGFTIVELLIVTVVIGILAAVSIVAYNGIQARAIETHNKTNVSGILKGIEIYNAENGSYPTRWQMYDLQNLLVAQNPYDDEPDPDLTPASLRSLLSEYRSPKGPGWMAATFAVGDSGWYYQGSEYRPEVWQDITSLVESRAQDVDLEAAAAGAGYASAGEYIDVDWAAYDDYWDYGDAVSEEHYENTHPQFACVWAYFNSSEDHYLDMCNFVDRMDMPAIDDIYLIQPIYPDAFGHGCFDGGVNQNPTGYAVAYFSSDSEAWVWSKVGTGVQLGCIL